MKTKNRLKKLSILVLILTTTFGSSGSFVLANTMEEPVQPEVDSSTTEVAPEENAKKEEVTLPPNLIEETLKEDKVDPEQRNVILPQLSIFPDKNELNAPTDQTRVSTILQYNNSFNKMNNGQIKMKASQGAEIVKYPTVAELGNMVTKVMYDNVKQEVTYILKEGITSGEILTIALTIRASGTAKKGEELFVTSQVTGTSDDGTNFDVVEATSTPIIVTEDFIKQVSPVNPSWRMPNINSQQYPGYAEVSPMSLVQQTPYKNESFENLKIVYKAKDADSLKIIIPVPGNAQTGLINGNLGSVKPNRTVIDDTTVAIEFGSLNGHFIKHVQAFNTVKIPNDAVPGTVYEVTTEVYDNDVLITTGTAKITVKANESTISLTTGGSTQVTENEQFTVTNAVYVNSAAPGVSNTQVTWNIPDKVTLNTLSQQINNGNGTMIKKVEYYNDGVWTAVTKKLADGRTYDFSEVPTLSKVRISYADKIIFTQSVSPVRMTFTNNGYKDGEKITVEPESMTYNDFSGEEKSLNVTGKQRTISVIGQTNQLAEIQSHDGIKLNAPSNDFDSEVKTIGDQFTKTTRIGSYQHAFDSPYIYFKLPQGLQLKTIANSIETPAGNLSYGYAPSFGHQSFPINKANNIGQVPLSDGTILYYFKADDTKLNPIEKVNMLLIDNVFTVGNMPAGDYEIEIGMGSLTQDDFTAYQGPTFNTGFTKNQLPAEIKEKLGATATNYLSKKKVMTVGDINVLSANVKIKGSEDADWIDASSNAHATSAPGKNVTYQVTMKNNGTSTLRNFELIDILPYVGDTLITNEQFERHSEFPIYATDQFSVTINGVEDKTATIEYSTSRTPERFNSAGALVPGDPWTLTRPSNVAAIRVTTPGKPLLPGDEVILTYTGTVPFDAKRPLAGQTVFAVNTVAYYAETTISNTNIPIAGEPVTARVTTTPVANDLELSGQAFMDLNKNGLQEPNEQGYNNVSLQLFKKNALGIYETVGTPISTVAASGTPGIFGFTDLTNGDYKIQVSLPETGTFITEGLDKITVDLTDPTKGWLNFNGSPILSIDDLGLLNPKTIKDLKIPIYTTTPLAGKVVFVNKNGASKNTTYGADYQVLLKNQVGKTIAETTADENGNYAFKDLDIDTETTYTIEFITPAGKNFVFADKNADQSGKLTVTLTPGIGMATTDISDIYITDIDNPDATIDLNEPSVQNTDWNPQSATIHATDATTDTTLTWSIKDQNGNEVYQGTNDQITPIKYLIADKKDGHYTISVTVTDAAGNTFETTKDFRILTATPTVTANADFTYEVNQAVTNPNYSKQDWMTHYQLTATDGFGQALTEANLTVDDSKVDYTKLGTYPVIFTVKDAAGNTETTERNMTVADTTAPTITSTEMASNSQPYVIDTKDIAVKELTEGQLLSSLGIQVTDNYDDGTVVFTKKATVKVTTDFNVSLLIPSKAGNLVPLTVTAEDSSGNQANEIFYVKVIDQTAPTFTSKEVAYPIYKDTITEEKFIKDAILNLKDDYSARDQIVVSTDFDTVVDWDTVGHYPVTVTIADEFGNEKTEQINVKITDKPVVMIEQNELTYEVHSKISDQELLKAIGVTIETQPTNEKAEIVLDTTQVNFKKLGSYQVTVAAINEQDQASDEKTVIVHIVDTEKPVITAQDKQEYLQNQPVSEEQFLQDIQAKATDNYDKSEDLTLTSDFESSVQFDQLGTYQVTLTTTDSSNNQTEKTVEVIIKAELTDDTSDETTQQKDSASNPSEKEQTKDSLPSTGEQQKTILWVIIGILLVGGGLSVIFYKRKKDRE